MTMGLEGMTKSCTVISNIQYKDTGFLRFSHNFRMESKIIITSSN